MTLFAKTEIDVLRESARKATLVPIEDPFEPANTDQSSVTGDMAVRRDHVKLALRIWNAVGKFIRSQCNKGRVIDSGCFGTFAKASAVGVTGPEAESHFVYCAGPNSPFNI